MKKVIRLFAICIILLGTLTGCKKETIKKILLEGQEGITTYVDITVDELDHKIATEEDFLLYIYNPTCGACMLFAPKLLEFIEDTETVVYRIVGNTIPKGKIKGLNYTPSLAFYLGGKLQRIVDPDKNSDPFNSTENLTNYIKKYAYLPIMKEISKETLDVLLSNDSDLIVYIASSSCGDCAHFNKNVIRPYLKKDNAIPFYYLDVDKFLSRSQDGQATEEWINFKNQYGLSEVGNPTYGYGSGYVPTVQRYEDGELVGAMVYLNDVKFENGQLVVTEGYYGSESGKVGQTFDDYAKYQDTMKSFYQQKFIDFMNSVYE